MTGPTVKFWDLPAPWKDRWQFAPGAFAWKFDGSQWVPLVPRRIASDVEIGRARLFERNGALYAELHFRDEFPVLAAWLKKLPKGIAEAGHPSLQLALKAEPCRQSNFERLVTHANAFAVAVCGLPEETLGKLLEQIEEVSPKRRQRPDPDGYAIAAWLKELEEDQDRGN